MILPAQIGEELAVIDIGSNSVRLVIYQTFGAHFTPVFNEKILAGLGRDLRVTGRLSVKGREDCLQAILRFQRIAKARDISKLLIGATAALRVAEDASEYLAQIKEATGLMITPISGTEEARLSAMGLLAADTRREGLAADLGGASLELVHIKARKIGESVSLPLGPFDVVEGPLSDIMPGDMSALSIKIDAELDQQAASLFKADTLFLIGGAWRNLAAVHQQRTLYPLRTLQDYRLDLAAAKGLAEWGSGEGAASLLDWSGLRKARAETLPYAALVLDRLLARVQPSSIVISMAGLREGLVQEALPEAVQGRDAFFDGLRDFAFGALQAEEFGDPLFEFLTPMLDLLPQMLDSHGDNRRMVKAACLLAGLGKNLHPEYRPELVFNDVLYAPVAGLTHEERAFLALSLFRSYAAKRACPNARAIETLLSDDQRDFAAIIGEAIRLAIVATGRSSGLLSAFRLKTKGDQLILSVEAGEQALITDQVMFRLKRLATLLGRTGHVDTHGTI
ncbi:Ppx/GppA family phosphatase [Litorimonas sp. RW-G-Af-16]|uniref:Ppx/GppA phosphatase family protein n=1 Tax=Litorimonas sp. RW-G-Af-16 TaxID=3241168 RepID=UPI00390C6070